MAFSEHNSLNVMHIFILFYFLYREEIRRLKINNPKITHKEAFSTAAKNVSWKTLIFLLSIFSIVFYHLNIPQLKFFNLKYISYIELTIFSS